MLHGGDAGQEEYLLNHIQSNSSNGHHNSSSSTQAASERKSDDSDCDMSNERKTIKQEAQNRVVHMLNTSTADVTAAAQCKRASGSNSGTTGSGSEAKGAKHSSDNSEQDGDCKGISSISTTGVNDKQRSLLGDLPELDKKVSHAVMCVRASIHDFNV
jgi:hypothetical protein